MKEKKTARQERNAQLIVWGLAVEKKYKNLPDEERKNEREVLNSYLETRNLARSEQGFSRLDAELKSQAEEVEQKGQGTEAAPAEKTAQKSQAVKPATRAASPKTRDRADGTATAAQTGVFQNLVSPNN
jgi:hypothetical protein